MKRVDFILDRTEEPLEAFQWEKGCHFFFLFWPPQGIWSPQTRDQVRAITAIHATAVAKLDSFIFFFIFIFFVFCLCCCCCCCYIYIYIYIFFFFLSFVFVVVVVVAMQS